MNNHYLQSEIMLHRPMVLVEDNGHTKTFRPVDAKLAGFVHRTECDKMVEALRAKYPDKHFETISARTTYAHTFKQYDQWRTFNKTDLELSFNKGCAEEIKDGLYLAGGKNGNYVGTYNNEGAALRACRSTGTIAGEETVIHQKVYSSYRGYKNAKSRTSNTEL